MPAVMHDLVLPLAWGSGIPPAGTPHSPLSACTLLPAPHGAVGLDPARRGEGKAAAGISLVYESTKLSQQAFSIPFICVSPLSSFYFP